MNTWLVVLRRLVRRKVFCGQLHADENVAKVVGKMQSLLNAGGVPPLKVVSARSLGQEDVQALLDSWVARMHDAKLMKNAVLHARSKAVVSLLRVKMPLAVLYVRAETDGGSVQGTCVYGDDGSYVTIADAQWFCGHIE